MKNWNRKKYTWKIGMERNILQKLKLKEIYWKNWNGKIEYLKNWNRKKYTWKIETERNILQKFKWKDIYWKNWNGKI